MFDNFNNFFNGYHNLSECYPWWAMTIIYVIHIIAVVVCMKMNNKDDKYKTSHNTLHSNLWLVLIIIFPFAGIIGYILLSIIPYNIWRKTEKKEPFFLSCMIYKRTWIFTIAAIIVGGIFSRVFDGSKINFSFAIPLSVWTLITFVDFLKNYIGKSLFVTLSDFLNPSKDLIEKEKIFGASHFAEKETDTEPAMWGEEARMVRSAVNQIMPDGIIPENSKDFTGSVEIVIDCKKKVKDYRYCGNSIGFKKIHADVYEAKYIGFGVTRYINAVWDSSDKNKCIDKVIYRATPCIKTVLMRSFILFLFVYVLCSPKTSEILSKIFELCEKMGG